VVFIFVSLHPPNSRKDFRGGRENIHYVVRPLCDVPCGLCACRWDRASKTMKPYDKSNVSRGFAVTKLSSDRWYNVRWFSRPFVQRDRSDTSESCAILICQFLISFSSPLWGGSRNACPNTYQEWRGWIRWSTIRKPMATLLQRPKMTINLQWKNCARLIIHLQTPNTSIQIQLTTTGVQVSCDP